MSTIPDMAARLRQILSTYADQIARTNGFVRRRDKPLTGAVFVQTLVFTLLAQPQAALAAYCRTAAACGVPISEQGLHQNFTVQAADLLLAVFQQAAATVIAAASPPAADLLARFSAVFVLASSGIGLPPALADLWPGCGNGSRPAPASSATLKLACGVELRHGQLFGVELLPGSVHDRATAVAAYPVPPPGVRLADRGFFKLARFAEITAADGFWFSRLQTGVILFTAPQVRWTLADWLAQQTDPQVDHWLELGVSERLPARLIAVRVTQEVADNRRRQLHAAAKRKAQPVSAVRLASVGWNVYVSNIPVAQLSVGEAVILAGVRWQIELLFKRWKSQGRIDEWTASTNKWRIMSEVYAKLIGMVLTHWIVVLSCWGLHDRSLGQATAVVRHYAVLLVSSWASVGQLVAAVELMARVIAATGHMAPHHKRPRTFQRLRLPAQPATSASLA